MVDPTGSECTRTVHANGLALADARRPLERGGATFSSSMDAAEAQQRADAEEELARSALRQAEIERRIAEAQQKLKDSELARARADVAA